jgi:hypothetical protein
LNTKFERDLVEKEAKIKRKASAVLRELGKLNKLEF